MSDPAGTRDTLVLGAGIGYDAAQLAPFVRSLRASGYRGDVTLIVAAGQLDALRAAPVLAGVSLVPSANWARCKTPITDRRQWRRLPWLPLQALGWAGLRVLRALGATDDRVDQIARRFYHPQMSRYFVYRDVLRRQRYRRVLLCDVRDVLFQSDPFATLPAQGLAVSMESSGYTLAEEIWNASWVRRAYGAPALARIGAHPVSCSGVTYGDYDSMLHYLDLMVAELRALPWRAVLDAGDQGMHNWLLWTGRLGDATRLENFSSAVATLNEVGSEHLRFDAMGRLLNRDGSIIGIVHQYDRLPKLAPRLFAALGLT